MSIAEKELEEIQQIKKSLYQSIFNKGADIKTNTPFEDYPDMVASIKGADSASVILKINPTPADATVVFTGKPNFLNQAACLLNSTIEYTVSKVGYITVTDSQTMDTNKEVSVVLIAE